MPKRALITIALSLTVWGCGTSSQQGTPSQSDRGEPPVIIDYHAAEVIRPGTTWRVYLKAKDNDGDMRDIVSRLSQTGFGSYPTSFTSIGEEHRSEVAGFLSLRTPSDTHLRNDRFSLRVFVRDSQGNRSEAVEIPLRFNNVPPAEIPEKWEKIADRRLGQIMVTIQSSWQRRGPLRRR
jgi:hypothetical protein